jgi:predicted nucleotidyltransferase
MRDDVRWKQRFENFGLQPEALELIRSVLRRHPEVRRVEVFGSRALGRFEDYSDVDLALWGDLDVGLIGRIAGELDGLPLPYTFDVKAYESMGHERSNATSTNSERRCTTTPARRLSEASPRRCQ